MPHTRIIIVCSSLVLSACAVDDASIEQGSQDVTAVPTCSGTLDGALDIEPVSDASYSSQYFQYVLDGTSDYDFYRFAALDASTSSLRPRARLVSEDPSFTLGVCIAVAVGTDMECSGSQQNLTEDIVGCCAAGTDVEVIADLDATFGDDSQEAFVVVLPQEPSGAEDGACREYKLMIRNEE